MKPRSTGDLSLKQDSLAWRAASEWPAQADMFRAVFDSFRDALLIFNDQLQIHDGNQALSQLLGVPQNELRTHSLFDAVTPAQRKKLRRWHKRLSERGQLSGRFSWPITNGPALQLKYQATANIQPGLHLLTLHGINPAQPIKADAQRREERYRAFVAQSTEGIWCIELDPALPNDLTDDEQIAHLYQYGYVAECNDTLARMYGYEKAEDMLGIRPGDLLPLSEETNQAFLRNFIRQGYRMHDTESHEVARYGQQKYFLNNATGIKENGLLKRIWGTQRDITERKQSDALLTGQLRVLELMASGAPLAHTLTSVVLLVEELFPQALCSILLLDEDGKHLRHGAAPNLPLTYIQAIDGLPIGPQAGSCGTAAYFGKEVVVSDIADDPLWKNYRTLALTYGLRSCWSKPICSASRQLLGTFAVYYREVRTPTAEEKRTLETVTHLASIALERHRTESVLRAREDSFRALIENSWDGIGTLDANGNIVYASPAISRMLGYAPEDMNGQSALFRIHSDDVVRLTALLEDTLQRPGQRHTVRYRAQHRDESWRWIEASVANLLNEPSVKAIIVNVRDITDRQLAEEALQASEERFALAFNASPEPMALITLTSGRILNANKAWAKQMRIPRKAAIGHTLAELGLARYPLSREQLLGWLQREGSIRDWEFSVALEDNEERMFRLSLELLEMNGEKVILSLHRDITERKRAEEELRASEARYRSLIATLDEGIVMQDQQGRIVACNASAERILGLPQAQLMGLDSFDPRWRAVRENGDPLMGEEHPAVITLRTGKPVSNTIIGVHRPDNTLRWLLVNSQPLVRENESTPYAAVVSFADITERKQAEEALRASEARFAKAFSFSPNPMALLTFPEGRFVMINESWQRDYGFTMEELSGHTSREVGNWVHASQREDFYELLMRDGQVHNFEATFFTKSGAQRFTIISAEIIELGDARYVLSSSNDITERQKAEAALRRSEEQSRALLDAIPDLMFHVNSEGVFLNYHATNHHNLYAPPEHFLGKSIRDVLPPDVSATCLTALAQSLQTQCLVGFEYQLTQNADDRVYEARMMAVNQNEALVLIRDITDRKRAEESLARSQDQLRALSARLEAIREEERIRISREIHDNLGQLLTGLKLDFSWLHKRLVQTSDASLRQKVSPKMKEVGALLEETIQTVRQIATDLRPGVLDTLGLRAAIDWQAHEFEKRTGVNCHLELDRDPDGLPPERATALFRIFQEILTNIARHAKARHVTVTLYEEPSLDESASPNASEIVLTVCDDGIGMTEAQKSNPKSLGLIGMQERALLFGGSVNIQSQVGQGTSITVRLPIP